MNNPRDLLKLLLLLFRRLYRLLTTGTFAVTVKLPASYDVSHWIVINNWNAISPVPLLMFTKATESDNYRDPTFPDYFAKMRDILGCKRGAYHFFRKAVDPVRQANWFADYVQPHITTLDVLCLDFEEGGETAPQLWAFLNRLKQRFPNNLIIIYSRKNLMDPIAMTSSEANFFKTFPTWVAGYPNDPNGYTSTPPGYIPRQDHWGPTWAWQYTDDLIIPGIEGNNVDGNLLEPPFIEWLGGATPEPPTEDEVTTPFEGVRRTVGRRFNSDVYITVMETSKVRFEVAHETPFDNGLFRTSDMCRTLGAQLGWNGDEWDKYAPLPAYPKNEAWRNGTRYRSRTSAEPSLNIRSNGQAEILHTTSSNSYNLSTGRRYLIDNGQIKDYLYGSEPQYTERHPRGLAGITQDGKVIMVTVDGRSDVSQGVTLLEGARILQEFGAYKAFDRGGGGDAVDVMNGIVQNVPCDTGTNGQPGVERAIPQSILVFAQGDTMPSVHRYDATALGDGTRLRLDHNTLANYVNSYPRGTVFSGDELFTAPTDLSNSSGVYQKAGDKWLRVILVNGQPPKNSSNQPVTQPVWVAVIHLGSSICSIVDNQNTPPAEGNISVTHTVTLEGYQPLTLTGELVPSGAGVTGASAERLPLPSMPPDREGGYG